MSKKTNSFPAHQQGANDFTCGSFCVKNTLESLGIKKEIQEILNEIGVLPSDSTWPGQLAKYLHSMNLETILFSSNAQIYSRNWQTKSSEEINALLEKWIETNWRHTWIKDAISTFSYLNHGGQLKIVDISSKMIDEYLSYGYTFIVCLGDAWMWDEKLNHTNHTFDSIRGAMAGHFVCVYGQADSNYLISDSYPTGLAKKDGLYSVSKDQLIAACLQWNPQIIAVRSKKK